MSNTDSSSIPASSWSYETRGAYLACAIDTDGWVSLRFTERSNDTIRITPTVGVTNTSVEFLERIADIANVPRYMVRNGIKGRDARGIVTRGDVWQSVWRSPLHVIEILEMAEPYLVAKRQRALWTLEFCRSRITPNGYVARKDRPYTSRCWELARSVSLANGRRTEFPEFREGHGAGLGRFKHNASDTPEYQAWKSAKHRANMCEAWRRSFEAFVSDIGKRPSPKHQLTRLDKDKPFDPDNARWVIR